MYVQYFTMEGFIARSDSEIGQLHSGLISARTASSVSSLDDAGSQHELESLQLLHVQPETATAISFLCTSSCYDPCRKSPLSCALSLKGTTSVSPKIRSSWQDCTMISGVLLVVREGSMEVFRGTNFATELEWHGVFSCGLTEYSGSSLCPV